jgi:hypothetical protein
MASLAFITSVTNNEYVTFLRSHLLTVERFHPKANVVVHYERLSADRVAALRLQFPRVRFQTAARRHAGRSKAHTIGGKVGHYLDALEAVPDGHGVVLIDCDTLVCRPIDQFFDWQFDVAFTWKEDGYPLNSGVMLGRAGRRLRRFLTEWEQLTQKILGDSRLMRRATALAGGADQYSLAQLVSRNEEPTSFLASSRDERAREYDGSISRCFDGEAVELLGLNAKYLNETRSCPITPETHVIHYKSGWHGILLRGEPFHRTRPRSESLEMFHYWNRWNRQAERLCAEAVASTLARSEIFRSRRTLPMVLEAAERIAKSLAVRRLVMLTEALPITPTPRADRNNLPDLEWLQIQSLNHFALPDVLNRVCTLVRKRSEPTLLVVSVGDHATVERARDVVRSALSRCSELAGVILHPFDDAEGAMFSAVAALPLDCGDGQTAAVILPSSLDVCAALRPRGLRAIAADLRRQLWNTANTTGIPKVLRRFYASLGH